MRDFCVWDAVMQQTQTTMRPRILRLWDWREFIVSVHYQPYQREIFLYDKELSQVLKKFIPGATVGSVQIGTEEVGDEHTRVSSIAIEVVKS